MPTRSKRLRSRAAAYRKASEVINNMAEDGNDATEIDDFYKVGKSLWMEYGRYTRLAEEREAKEKE